MKPCDPCIPCIPEGSSPQPHCFPPSAGDTDVDAPDRQVEYGEAETLIAEIQALGGVG